MWAFGRSITELAIAVLGIATLVFLAFAVVPLDPARAILGPNASEEAVSLLRAEYGLDQPLPIRYGRTMVRMAQGDFGDSYFYKQSAGSLVMDLAPITLARAGTGLLIGVVTGLFLAWWVSILGIAVWIRPVFVLFQSLPSFCIMLISLWFLSRVTGQTPMVSPLLYEAATLIGAAFYPAGAVGFFILERLAPTKGLPRHIDFLQLLGAPQKYIQLTMIRDAVPGSLAIAINALGVSFTAVLFAELIFGLRGFGVIFIRSCERGDMSVVMAGSMLLCIVVILVQRVGDMVVRWMDPRFSSD